MTCICMNSFVIDQTQEIEIVYGNSNVIGTPLPAISCTAPGIDQAGGIKKMPSFHTPRTSCGSDSTPHSGDLSELGEPRFSNDSDCGTDDVKNAPFNGAKSTPSHMGETKEELASHYEEGISKDMSRRLVEYFVVVSSVPKIRKRKDPEKSPKQCDGESVHMRTAIHYPNQSSQMMARVNVRRAHLEKGWNTAGCDSSGSAANTGDHNGHDGKPTINEHHASTPSRSGGAAYSNRHSGESPINNIRASTPSPIQTVASIDVLAAGEPLPDEGKSTANLLTMDEILGETDERSTASSSTTQTLKNNFLRSVNEQKKKIQASAAKFQVTTQKRNASMQKRNAMELQNLEKTLENLNLDKTLVKFKSLKLPTSTASFVEDEGRIRQKEARDGDDQSSSSHSSFSRDAVIPSSKERTASFGDVEGSTFRPSQIPTSARRPPAPLSPTPPTAVTASPLLDRSFTPQLPDRSITLGGSSRNVRILPMLEESMGATDNIRIGHEQDFCNREYNDNIEDCILESVITAQYPPVDHPNQPLNPMLPHFCHPQGTDVIVPLHEYKMPTVHHFVLTDSKGGKLYGTCLTVYEEFSLHSNIEMNSGENDNIDQSRIEGQECDYVECLVHGSPKAGQSCLHPKDHKYYAPRVLCLLSTWPYLSAFRTYLVQLYRLATTTNLMVAPLERYILNICAEVPAPPPGSFEVKLSILDSNIRFWAPPADQPIPYVSLPYGVLFECLDIGNVLFAWYTLACERKLLLVSSQLSLLTVCAEILCSMLFPMRWSHLYIPCLPRFLTPMLDAPMPYLCGISREVFPYAVREISEETVVVDLDRNVITMGRHTPDLPLLPYRRKAKLEATLEQHAGDVFWKARGLTPSKVEQARLSGDENLLAKILGTADAVWDEKVCLMDEAFNLAYAPDSMTLLYSGDTIGLDDKGKQSRWDAVQEAFLRFYVSMLKDYRKYMPSIPNDKQSTWRGLGSVDAGRFLADEFVQSQLPDFQPFLDELIGTQQFDDFITRRMYNAGDAPDVTFFDQSIDAKRNRSKLKLKKKETPFLHSALAHRDLKQVEAIHPNQDNLPTRSRFDHRFNFKKGEYNYPTWPESFDESLFGKPRPIPKIITAEFDRRSALAAMLRTRCVNIEDARLSGSNNPSPEATAFVLFFVTFSNTIGKEWMLLEKKHAIMDENMLDQCTDGVSIESSSNPEGPWNPKVNPPWMAGESFHSLHLTLSPGDILHDVGSSNGFCAPNCTNFCSDIGKAIDPLTFIGIPWTRNESKTMENLTPGTNYAKSPSEEELENETEKARAIAKAQIDLGFNTLKMMRMRKLPTESIMYKTLIEACGRCGIAHRTHQLMEMMTQDGMALDSEVYFAFMKAFSNLESETVPPCNKGTDTTSEFSATRSNLSATSSSYDFPDSSHGEVQQSKKPTMLSSSTKLIDGFQNAMSSTIVANRRAFKSAKTKRLQRLFKQKLTKKKNLHVTRSIKTHLELGNCILEDVYPGIKIDADSDTCPKCSCVLGQDNIILGWQPCQVKDFSTLCPSCKHRFVPKFSVSCNLEAFEGSQGKGTPLYCDYLSPWVLLQEIRNLISTSVDGKAARVLGVESDESNHVGIDKIIDPKFREGSGINATLWWNMIVTFIRFKIPFTFLLQGSYEDQQLIMPSLEDT